MYFLGVLIVSKDSYREGIIEEVFRKNVEYRVIFFMLLVQSVIFLDFSYVCYCMCQYFIFVLGRLIFNFMGIC